MENSQSLYLSTFRAYDIRGIVGKTLTEKGVYLIGKVLGSLVQEKGGTQIVIARDGRNSGPKLSKALAEGILSSGCNVVDLSMVPTPLLYFATHLLSEANGVMLTGSHNPPDYNGLKMVIQGKMLAESEITNLYHRAIKSDFLEGKGIYSQQTMVESYIQQIINTIKLKRPLKIVVDAGNGVTGVIGPQLFKALGCEVIELFCEIDGNFPNHHADPTEAINLQDLIAAVQTHKADLGIAFDGDGDRLGMVTNAGTIICPDRLLMLFAKDLLSKSPHAKIIYDVKCSNHLAPLILEKGGEPIMWKTGHSHIKSKMQEINAALAGEMSGHFFFKDGWYGFDDALYSAARLLEIVGNQTESTENLFNDIPNSINTPELRVLVREEEKFELMKQLIAKANFPHAKEVTTIDGLRINFSDGWGLVRPSNTTPYLILRFEAISEAMLDQLKNLFRDWMLSVKPDLVLPF